MVGLWSVAVPHGSAVVVLRIGLERGIEAKGGSVLRAVLHGGQGAPGRGLFVIPGGRVVCRVPNTKADLCNNRNTGIKNRGRR